MTTLLLKRALSNQVVLENKNTLASRIHKPNTDAYSKLTNMLFRPLKMYFAGLKL